MDSYFDISPLISPRLAVFPGDQPFAIKNLMSFSAGQHLELSSILTTPHIGAHADATIHYHPDGKGISARPLKHYLGPCQVMHIQGLAPKARIGPEHLLQPIEAPRLLFRTDSFLSPEIWTEDFNSLSAELIEHLADQGVCTVGIDTPSVDPADSKDLPSHKALWKTGVAVLEGLVLEQVPEGFYTLVALPLNIEGLDASPVRAILLPKGALS